MSAPSAVPPEARPAIERFLAALAGADVDALYAAAAPSFRAGAPAESLRPVLGSMGEVLGPRRAASEPSVRSTKDGGARLHVEVPVTHERGDAVVGLVAVRDGAGRWAVAECATRAPAFTWRLR